MSQADASQRFNLLIDQNCKKLELAFHFFISIHHIFQQQELLATEFRARNLLIWLGFGMLRMNCATGWWKTRSRHGLEIAYEVMPAFSVLTKAAFVVRFLKLWYPCHSGKFCRAGFPKVSHGFYAKNYQNFKNAPKPVFIPIPSQPNYIYAL